MSGRLNDAVHELDADVSAADLADAVWLLGVVRPGTPDDRPQEVTARPERKSGVPDDGPSDARFDTGADADAVPEQTTPPSPDWEVTQELPGLSLTGPVAEWHLPRPDRLMEGPSRIPVRSPGAAALPGTLAMARALRPLRRRMPSHLAILLDEEETVRLATDGDLWVPVLRPAPDRWLDLAIVIDDSPSMVIWRRVTAELRDLMQRMGAFRDIRVWRCDTDLRGGDRLTLRPEAGSPDGAGRDVRELIDPRGRRAVLLVSDCVGRAWATGEMARALRIWGTGGPVAIVQTLPQRLWDMCAPSFVPARFSARRPGAPNAELEVRILDGHPPDGMAVPVLELEARWFARWAALVASTGSDGISGTAIFADGGPAENAPAENAPAEARPAPDGDSADELLEHFASFASTGAMRLAACLAGAPLNLPVMRLVQHAMLPGSRPSVLAEVFLSGLLLRRTRAFGPETHPDDVEYDFLPGVRDRLLLRLPRNDKLAVLAKVSDFVSARLGSPVDFRAFLTAEDSAAALLQSDPPFARVALHVLDDLGGRYREAAATLRRKTIAHAAEDTSEREMPESPVIRQDSPEKSALRTYTPTGDSMLTTAAAPPTDQALEAATEHIEVGTQPAIFENVPYRNPNFTGRVDLLRQLRTNLLRWSKQMALLPHALHGLGGVGKTQLAVEYAYRYASEYDLVWWAPAESPTAVRASLAQLAERMGLPGGDVSQKVANVLAALRTGKPHRRWLVVFDNADEPEQLKEYLPHPLGHVLITSRNPHWAEVAAQLEVDVFARDESIALLQRRGRGISVSEAERLAEKLGDLPLALDQAAAWQSETAMPVQDMVRLLDERMHQLLIEYPSASYPASVMATWELSFTALREQSPGAAQLLELCAFFGSEPISISLLWDGRLAELPPPAARVLRDDIALRRAIRDIHRYALAKVDPGRNRIEVHRLVQAVLRARMSDEQREAAQDAVHNILGLANPRDPDNPRNWERHAELQPHVTPSNVMDAKTEIGRRVALDQIRYRFIRGDYERSSHLGQFVVDRWRDTLGLDNELTLIAQRHLAIALRELGDRDSAARLNQETLERLRAVFGVDHEHTLATANSYGADLRLRGEFRQARKLDEENLERHRRIFRSDDPETLKMMNNVAVDLRLLGDVGQALELDSETQRLYESVLGGDHPLTFGSLANVARDHVDAGNYRQAHALLADALPRMRSRLGEGARETLIATRVFVMVQRRLGAFGQARELAEELYLGTRRTYREDNERMLAVTMTYANALLAVGERARARSLADEAWQRYRSTFGERHPFTLAAAVNVAVILRAGEEYAPARELGGPTLDTLRAELGDDHPYTLFAMINHSNDLHYANDPRQALKLSEEAYTRSKAVRGVEHPDTAACALNYSLDLEAAGDRAQGQTVFDEAVAQLRRALGDGHPTVKAAGERRRRMEADIETWAT